MLILSIYKIALRRLGDHAKLAGSGLVMAILGGVVAAAAGGVGDRWGAGWCFGYARLGHDQRGC